MTSTKIVVVEDEPDIRTCISYALESRGYSVQAAGDGAEAMQAIRRDPPDLVVLDRMLPDTDGIELCRRLRSDPATRAIPVVIVSARDAESDVVGGLGDGADDYLTKPFRPAELTARVAAVLRRRRTAGGPVPPGTVRSGPLHIDGDRGRVTLDGQELDLSSGELRLLHVLASEPGRVFTRSQLLDRIAGGAPDLVYRNIDLLVSATRRKLGDAGTLIETVRDLGYRLRDTGR